MSNRAITWCLHQQDIPALHKWVLAVLCNAAIDKDDLRCSRSHSLLSRETGLDRSAVVYKIADLIRNRKIEKVGIDIARKGSTIYRILVAENNRQWLPGTTRPSRRLVAENNQASCGEQPVQLLIATSASCPAQHITKEPIFTRRLKKGSAASDDPRRAPFLEFIFNRQPKLKTLTHVSAFKELKLLLSKTKGKDGFTLDDLKACWIRFEQSRDEFHHRQGQPLRYFCTNLPAFMGGNNNRSGQSDSQDLEKLRSEMAAQGFEV